MKNGQVSTDTPILLSIVVFQAFVILCLGMLNMNTNDYSSTEQIGFNAGTQYFSFGNIINNITILGWGNTIIFAPLELCLIYIVAKLIRGGG